MDGAVAAAPAAAPTAPRPAGARNSSSSLDSEETRRRMSEMETVQLDIGEKKARMSEAWRRRVGLSLLFCTVVLWTASNFLASTLFADDTYSKPYFVTYVNTSFFILPLIPLLLRQLWRDPRTVHRFLNDLRQAVRYQRLPARTSLEEEEEGGGGEGGEEDGEEETFLKPDSSPRLSGRPHALLDTSREASREALLPRSQVPVSSPPRTPTARAPSIRSLLSSTTPAGGGISSSAPLSLIETARLSLEFCLLWYLANYFVAACLSYTTVASSTILTSTSSVFTLLFGVLLKVSRFQVRTLLGVLCSLLGIVLISSVDLSGSSDRNRGSFPHKSVAELGIGDGMALLSAVLYGLYAVFMKKRIGDEGRVDMPLFFGLVGLFNVLLLWPGMVVLHVTKVETFELPPTRRVAAIVAVNSLSSLVSDFAWAYAVLLTSPIVVTVGLSTTIPLSLIGQVLLNGQTSSWIYWVGALVVVASFVVVNREEDNKVDESPGAGTGTTTLDGHDDRRGQGFTASTTIRDGGGHTTSVCR